MTHHICTACGEGFDCQPDKNEINDRHYCDECYFELRYNICNPRSFNTVPPFKQGLTPRQYHKLGDVA